MAEPNAKPTSNTIIDQKIVDVFNFLPLNRFCVVSITVSLPVPVRVTRRILNQRLPSVIPLDFDSCRLCGGLTVKALVRLDEVVVNLRPLQNRGIHSLEALRMAAKREKEASEIINGELDLKNEWAVRRLRAAKPPK